MPAVTPKATDRRAKAKAGAASAKKKGASAAAPAAEPAPKPPAPKADADAENATAAAVATAAAPQRAVGSRVFQPYRALGYISNEVPFVVQTRGGVHFVTTCIGRSFQIYDVREPVPGPFWPARLG